MRQLYISENLTPSPDGVVFQALKAALFSAVIGAADVQTLDRYLLRLERAWERVNGHFDRSRGRVARLFTEDGSPRGEYFSRTGTRYVLGADAGGRVTPLFREWSSEQGPASLWASPIEE